MVGTAEYAWWSVNYIGRIARLSLHDEKKRTILFFANDRILAELEEMRASYGDRRVLRVEWASPTRENRPSGS